MQNRPHAIMLFAAGFGTRMGDLTADKPKPLIAVAGRPLLDHALDIVSESGLSKIVVNAHYRSDQIRAHIAEHPDIAVSEEIPDILETGGGLRHALPLLGREPVLTLNTDAVWDGPNPLTQLLEAWDPNRMDALLLTVPKNRAIGHAGQGDFIAHDGVLQRGHGEIYTGAQIIKTDALNDISETAFSLNLLWDRMLADERLFGLSYCGQWCDVGRPECLSLAESVLNHV